MKHLIKEALEDVKLEKLISVLKKQYVGKCFKTHIKDSFTTVLDFLPLYYDVRPILGLVQTTFHDGKDCNGVVNMRRTDFFQFLSNTIRHYKVHPLFPDDWLDKMKELGDMRSQLLQTFKGIIVHDKNIGYFKIEDFSFEPIAEQLSVWYTKQQPTNNIRNKEKISKAIREAIHPYSFRITYVNKDETTH